MSVVGPLSPGLARFPFANQAEKPQHQQQHAYQEQEGPSFALGSTPLQRFLSDFSFSCRSNFRLHISDPCSVGISPEMFQAFQKFCEDDPDGVFGWKMESKTNLFSLRKPVESSCVTYKYRLVIRRSFESVFDLLWKPQKRDVWDKSVQSRLCLQMLSSSFHIQQLVSKVGSGAVYEYVLGRALQRDASTELALIVEASVEHEAAPRGKGAPGVRADVSMAGFMLRALNDSQTEVVHLESCELKLGADARDRMNLLDDLYIFLANQQEGAIVCAPDMPKANKGILKLKKRQDLFGISLREHMNLQFDAFPNVGLPVMMLFLMHQVVVHGGAEVEGTFRLSPAISVVQEIKARLQAQPLHEFRGVLFDMYTDSFAYASLLKEWVGALEPSIIGPHDASYLKLLSISVASNAAALLDSLDVTTRSVLIELMFFISCFAAPEVSRVTRMELDSLLLMFLPSCVRAPTSLSPRQAMDSHALERDAFRLVYDYVLTTFGGDSPQRNLQYYSSFSRAWSGPRKTK